MKKSLREFCLENGKEALLAQWDGEKNAPLTPEAVSFGSKQRAWWRCEKGHEWLAAVCTRAGRGDGCPYCSGRRTTPGESDLATLYPDLAAQWHPTKNGALTPSEVAPGSRKKVWWRCEKGHEWASAVKSRTAGCGCPVCAGKEVLPGCNDLAALYPDLAAQWHPTKNDPLTPEQILPGSGKKVWWRCEKGHEWLAAVKSRTAGCGCPVCAGRAVLPGYNDLAHLYPALAAQWDGEKNGALTPGQVTPNSKRTVWWLCPQGHSYQAEVHRRTYYGSGCPYCSGSKVLPGFNDLRTVAPGVAAQWHPTLNDKITPEMVSVGSRRKAWWLCPDGHTWRALVFSRAGSRKCGCPICAGRAKKAVNT